MIRTELDVFLDRCAAKGVALDTNTALLLAAGRVDRALIPTWKRTRQFATVDYEILERLVEQFARLVTTPNVCTEVANFAGELTEPKRSKVLRMSALEIPTEGERYFPTASAITETAFVRLELADTSLLMLAREGFGVITVDLGLYLELQRERFAVLNFNHLRSWLYG